MWEDLPVSQYMQLSAKTAGNLQNMLNAMNT